jgi:hypothetical protein
MTPESVARIVERRGEPAFISLLREADTTFVDARFEAALTGALRAEPQLIDLWATYSADQRWTPSAYVEGNETGWYVEGNETGWYDAGYQQVRVHPDEGAAVADFIRRLAAWLARREVIKVESLRPARLACPLMPLGVRAESHAS